jgi:hypothetical protein
MRLLDGKRRRKGHDKGRQGWRSLAWALLFRKRSAPPFILPLTRSRRAVSKPQTLQVIIILSALFRFCSAFWLFDDNK